ncbi:phenylalanine 4-monooxygenase [Desertibaculum subflavum]|uniref:phenylalanine 4-monooxygenase n=1 Tax=Desertibaculum subflavum TaxID=2268458 RepID=UPI0034D2AB8F
MMDAKLRGDYSKAAADGTVVQDWSAYTAAEHALWRRLYARQAALLPAYGAPAVNRSLARLDAGGAIPDFARVNRSLAAATGWQLVAVPGLVDDAVFFAHLAARRFPVTVWLRRPDEVDYLAEPDIFHDFFGHVPLLFDPVFADFMQAYGRQGLAAAAAGTIGPLARLYWYTVEFGLIREAGRLKVYGAGILSSRTETVYAVEDRQPLRLRFDLRRIMRSDYRIDRLQDTYFVIDGYDELFAALNRDLAAELGAAAAAPAIAPGAVAPGDRFETIMRAA